jgi:K+-sensing histidine kinase KdpD
MPIGRIHWATVPKWSLAIADLLLVLLLGVIDYMSGDYSLIIYYMIPVVLGSWIIGAGFGIAVAVISGLVRFSADYATYTDFSFVNYLNVAQDTLFLLIIAFITANLRARLEGNKVGPPDRKNNSPT